MWTKIINDSNGNVDLPNLTNYNFHTANDNLKIKLPRKAENKGFVTFIDDDCRIGAYTKLVPLFESRGVKVNLACATGWIDKISGMPEAQHTYMNWDQVKEVQDKGHEILGHSVNHRNHGSLTNSAQLFEFEQCKKRLIEQGIAVQSYVYPYNGFNDFTIRNVTKYYQASFRGGEIANKPPLGYSLLNRVTLGFGQTGTTQSIKDKIANAKAKGEWISLMTHVDHTDATWTLESNLAVITEILDYCLSNGIEVLTVREALKRIGDAFTIGQNEIGGEEFFAIGADKKVYTNVEHWKVWKRVTDGEEKDIIVNIPSIPPMSSLTVNVNFGLNLTNKNVIITPVTSFADEIIWSHKTNGSTVVRVTLFNSGATTITLGDITFRVMVL